MAVKGDNSAFFGKDKLDIKDLQQFDVPKIKVPNNDFSNLTDKILSPENLAKEQIEKQNEILKFLKAVTIKQSKTAETQERTSKKQFYANLFLAIATLIIGIFALKPVFSDQSNIEYKVLYEQTLKLEKEKLIQERTISELSNDLLDLQNQVRILEKQNELLSTRKPLKK
ncbi:hypothetical protein CW731_05435 [Polaribacter sp. ALD11]|uniref:hypothetical protein n=1 Tax=Polaribacter sp. ALD11 TaxID=2058137 RepID=UPI000C31172B|nr:hypothetical protein [Polaribacter sp. ALD11]AUC84769.1 hypothetical protein CW731_05435 [Polaribacter sp. ALD11]